MSRAEEISRAFDYGGKAFLDREAFPLPPEDWPEHARQEFNDGYYCAAEKWDRTGWKAKFKRKEG